MEHREPPRMATAGDASPEPGIDRESMRRFARFVPPPSVRRVALPRLVLALLAAAGALGVTVVVGRMAVSSFVAYLHRQPEYEFAFGDLVLEPPPPSWLRGGRGAFLERVRTRGALPQRQSILDLDLKRLERAFQLDCWVKQVHRVECSTFPARVVVRLVYREPVAYVEWNGPKVALKVVLDADGVILPGEDVLRDATRLIPIYGIGRPLNPQFGETWKKKAETTGEPEEDRLVIAAARLADFLTAAVARDKGRLRSDLGFVILDHKERLWVQYGRCLFRWQDTPQAEPDGRLTDQARWSILSDWIEGHAELLGPSAGSHTYYKIEPGGIEPVPVPGR